MEWVGWLALILKAAHPLNYCAQVGAKTDLDQLNSHYVIKRVWRLLAATQLVLECLPWDPSLIQLLSVAGVYLGNKGDEAVCVS